MPIFTSASSLADSFASFFTDKISKLRLSLVNNSTPVSPRSPSPQAPPRDFLTFVLMWTHRYWGWWNNDGPLVDMTHVTRWPAVNKRPGREWLGQCESSRSCNGSLHFLTWLSLSQFAERNFGLSTYFSQKSKVKSYVQTYGLSTYLDWSLVELWSK